jgi:hypothetical protein
MQTHLLKHIFIASSSGILSYCVCMLYLLCNGGNASIYLPAAAPAAVTEFA